MNEIIWCNAKYVEVSYKIAWNIWKPGETEAYQLPNGAPSLKLGQGIFFYRFSNYR